MPYKSDSQRRAFHAKARRGEISEKVVREFDEASKGMDLPEKVNSRREGRPRRRERVSRKER